MLCVACDYRGSQRRRKGGSKKRISRKTRDGGEHDYSRGLNHHNKKNSNINNNSKKQTRFIHPQVFKMFREHRL